MTKQRPNSTESQEQETSVAHGGLTTTEREQMVAVAAYYRAEQRGFSSGNEVEDWLWAEKEIESLAVGTDAESVLH